MKNTKLLIASTRNWCTLPLESYFTSNDFDCYTVSGDRSFGNFNVGYLLWPIRLISRNFAGNYYESIFNIIECYLFDYIICIFILFRRPDCCLLWSGMSANSIKLCKTLNIKTCLWVGEEYLGSSKKRNILNIREYWIEEIDKSLNNVDIVLVESSFVLNSLPFNIQSKTHVVFSLVSNDFFISEKKSINSCSYPFRLGIIGTSLRKNTQFLIDTLNSIENQRYIEIYVFGDLSFFQKELILKRQIKLVFCEYYHNVDDYVNALKMVDMYLFPSVSDAGPRSMLEVVLLGIDIIASKSTIAPDLVKYFPNVKVLELNEKLWLEGIFSHNQFGIEKEHFKNIKKFQREQNKRLLKVCDMLSS